MVRPEEVTAVSKNRSRLATLPRALAALCAISVSTGCAHRVLEPRLHPADAAPAATERVALKAHMLSGELYVLDSWRVSDDGARLAGTGTRYSLRREPLSSGPVAIDVADVALFETNRPDKVSSGGTAVLAVMSTVFGGITAYCLSDPKACFGSCPTFYLGRDDARPVAEGFSASIARALEARDVDALGPAAPGRRALAVTMRNEAFETHVVRRVRLRVAERPAGGRVLAGIDGRFYPATGLQAPRSCRAAEGDCLAALVAAGGQERFSAADSDDLATRETVEVEFAAAGGFLGVVVGGRQTLLSTHLFYQTMAWLGSRAGDYLASLERGGPALAGQAMGMARLLGGIEAEVSEDGGEWRPIGSFDEAGPIAGDVQVLPFEAKGGGPLRVRLRQAKGHWRLDHVALARLGAPVAPRALEPVEVEKGTRRDSRARALLRDGARHLITLPGDEYRLTFALPEAAHGLEVFLESEGYYYEWMREEWLAEEDAQMAALVLSDPAEVLRRAAGPFKSHEAEMEQVFWASRFRR
jgi:hypothetical protein